MYTIFNTLKANNSKTTKPTDFFSTIGSKVKEIESSITGNVYDKLHTTTDDLKATSIKTIQKYGFTNRVIASMEDINDRTMSAKDSIREFGKEVAEEAAKAKAKMLLRGRLKLSGKILI